MEELGCSEEISSFVLPTGMTINMNGTTVMHMFAVTFSDGFPVNLCSGGDTGDSDRRYNDDLYRTVRHGLDDGCVHDRICSDCGG